MGVNVAAACTGQGARILCLGLAFMPRCWYFVLNSEVHVPALEQSGGAELLLHCGWLLLCPRQLLLGWSHPETNCPVELGTCSIDTWPLFVHQAA